MSYTRFPTLPDEVGGHVLDNVEAESFSSCVLVNVKWAQFFTQKAELVVSAAVKTVMEMLDPAVCKEKTLEEIKPYIERALRFANMEQKKSLYLALKKLEEEVMDITANPLFRASDHEQLKINHKEINQYLMEKFGIAGLINSWTIKRIFVTNGKEDIAKAFAELLALETVLQTQEQLTHFELICAHLINANYSICLEFKENALYFTGDKGSISIGELVNEALQSGECSKSDFEVGVEEYNKIMILLGYPIPEERAHMPLP